MDEIAAPQLPVSMSFRMYISCVLLVHTALSFVAGSASCGEACLDNICQTCCGSNRERKDWSAFSYPWKSSLQPKDVEKWSFALSLLLAASLSGGPGQTLGGEQHMCFFHV